MLSKDTQETIKAYFEEELESGRKNVYFDLYFSGKVVSPDRVQSILEDITGEEVGEGTQLEDGILLFRIAEEPVIFNQVSEDRWLVIYSTSLRDRDRKDMSDLAGLRGWLIESWIPSGVVEGLYREFAPGNESVNLERRWDPYWIYQRQGEVPDDLARYYSDNIEEFVEQEIQFSLKTPRRMVDQALRMGVTDELLDKSEISKSKFKIQIPESEEIQSDGGILSASPGSSNRPTAGVMVRRSGKVAHTSGGVDATFYLLEELDRRNTIQADLREVVGEHEYREHENGILELERYTPSKVLKIAFKEKEYNPEASIKLLNILTVGHNDVELHGITVYQDELEFAAESHTVFDGGEYMAVFTESEVDGVPRPTLYLRPEQASVAGLAYVFQKVLEKFDPRVHTETVDSLPDIRGE